MMSAETKPSSQRAESPLMIKNKRDPGLRYYLNKPGANTHRNMKDGGRTFNSTEKFERRGNYEAHDNSREEAKYRVVRVSN